MVQAENFGTDGYNETAPSDSRFPNELHPRVASLAFLPATISLLTIVRLTETIMSSPKRCIGVLAALFLLSTQVNGDTVEFLTGATLQGQVTGIRADQKEFDFRSRVGRRTVQKTYRFAEVHAVTIRGKRHVLTPKLDGAGGKADAENLTPEEIKNLIQQEGSKPPRWLASTKLSVPNSLDMDWPLKPPKNGWNNQVNVGQYIWDIVNPNPSRWRMGVKLVTTIIDSHQDDRQLLIRDQKALGRMYFHLFQDYARAAYWFEQAQVNIQDEGGVMLAECYFQLGSRDMAMQMLRQRRLPPGAIKLLAELGETDSALRLTRMYMGTQAEPEVCLLAGDALRNISRNDEAIQFYERVINSNKARNKDYQARYVGRAQDSIEAIKLAEKADVSKVADGKYRESSTGYNGLLEIEVSVRNKKIESVRVVDHKEKQFYASLRDTPKQIVEKQSVVGIDGFSGATITSAAIVNATAKALAKGAK
ncbi:MAG TPA: hypothetical protein DDW52_08900 [Planctomycetaceae bacterium]|nr:hypothetical protein [Planctomycetaceae bacterium]